MGPLSLAAALSAYEDQTATELFSLFSLVSWGLNFQEEVLCVFFFFFFCILFIFSFQTCLKYCFCFGRKRDFFNNLLSGGTAVAVECVCVCVCVSFGDQQRI